MSSQIFIDGSQGEGGGQVLRSSLALSLVTGKPFCIENIRAGRKKPGLMRQHLTAVNAATEIGAADVTGDSIGSTRLTFRPHKIKSGDFHFCIGTAGSTTHIDILQRFLNININVTKQDNGQCLIQCVVTGTAEASPGFAAFAVPRGNGG